MITDATGKQYPNSSLSGFIACNADGCINFFNLSVKVAFSSVKLKRCDATLLEFSTFEIAKDDYHEIIDYFRRSGAEHIVVYLNP